MKHLPMPPSSVESIDPDDLDNNTSPNASLHEVIATRMHWYKEKTIFVLIQLALSKHPDLPDVPLIMDLAKTEEQRQMLTLVFARQTMGRPFMAPPGVPQDRVAALRKAESAA